MTGPARGWPRLVLGDEDQLIRLTGFRDAHPEVLIGDGGFTTWQARIPEPNGETTITRYTLRELLDQLAVIYPDLPSPRGAQPPQGTAR